MFVESTRLGVNPIWAGAFKRPHNPSRKKIGDTLTMPFQMAELSKAYGVVLFGNVLVCFQSSSKMAVSGVKFVGVLGLPCGVIELICNVLRRKLTFAPFNTISPPAPLMSVPLFMIFVAEINK